jgi:hypothetical protein
MKYPFEKENHGGKLKTTNQSITSNTVYWIKDYNTVYKVID